MLVAATAEGGGLTARGRGTATASVSLRTTAYIIARPELRLTFDNPRGLSRLRYGCRGSATCRTSDLLRLAGGKLDSRRITKATARLDRSDRVMTILAP